MIQWRPRLRWDVTCKLDTSDLLGEACSDSHSRNPNPRSRDVAPVQLRYEEKTPLVETGVAHGTAWCKLLLNIRRNESHTKDVDRILTIEDNHSLAHNYYQTTLQTTSVTSILAHFEFKPRISYSLNSASTMTKISSCGAGEKSCQWWSSGDWEHCGDIGKFWFRWGRGKWAIHANTDRYYRLMSVSVLPTHVGIGSDRLVLHSNDYSTLAGLFDSHSMSYPTTAGSLIMSQPTRYHKCNEE